MGGTRGAARLEMMLHNRSRMPNEHLYSLNIMSRRIERIIRVEKTSEE
jgi:hypothetical protein